MADITTYIRAAGTSLAGGAAIPGPDAASDRDELAFALPANAGSNYCKRKRPAVIAQLSDFALLWEAE